MNTTTPSLSPIESEKGDEEEANDARWKEGEPGTHHCSPWHSPSHQRHPYSPHSSIPSLPLLSPSTHVSLFLPSLPFPSPHLLSPRRVGRVTILAFTTRSAAAPQRESP